MAEQSRTTTEELARHRRLPGSIYLQARYPAQTRGNTELARLAALPASAWKRVTIERAGAYRRPSLIPFPPESGLGQPDRGRSLWRVGPDGRSAALCVPAHGRLVRSRLSVMSRKGTEKRQAKRDAEYRNALGLSGGGSRSSALGSGHSPEPIDPAAGKRKSSEPTYRGKRRVRNRAIRPDAANLPLTTEQQRSVKCPRCLAKPGDPCRNQYGKAVSGGHADRRWKARGVHRRKLISKTPKDRPLTTEQHANLVARKDQVHDPGLLPRRHRVRVDNG
jgi:hypothetical protein